MQTRRQRRWIFTVRLLVLLCEESFKLKFFNNHHANTDGLWTPLDTNRLGNEHCKWIAMHNRRCSIEDSRMGNSLKKLPHWTSVSSIPGRSCFDNQSKLSLPRSMLAANGRLSTQKQWLPVTLAVLRSMRFSRLKFTQIRRNRLNRLEKTKRLIVNSQPERQTSKWNQNKQQKEEQKLRKDAFIGAILADWCPACKLPVAQ